jgi:CheY-like chemotaxis protein
MGEIKTVLIVDDSGVSRMMLRAIIENTYDDWNILEAADAREAEKLSETNQIDLITLDMNMPGMDGLTVAPVLKKNCPASRIALLTANFQERVKSKAEMQGLTFIPKPITEDKVLEFIEKSL